MERGVVTGLDAGQQIHALVIQRSCQFPGDILGVAGSGKTQTVEFDMLRMK